MSDRPDEANAVTEVLLSDLESRLKKEYEQAAHKAQEKLDDYLRRFEIKDKIKRKQLQAGEITRKEYNNWRTGQIMIGKRWEEMRDALADDLRNTDKIARSIIDGYKPDVYALNHNYATFCVERDSLVDTSYSLYHREAVEYIMRENPDLLPPPGKRVKNAIAEGRAVRWQRQQVQSVVMQSIFIGDSIPEIAKRVSNTLGERNLGNSIRYARTAMTGAQNAGRLDAFRRADKMGIKTRKTWIAALDSRTRHEHRKLDRQTVDIDAPFQNAFGRIMYPGDPNAAAANIWNCRCTMVSQIAGFERDFGDLRLRNTEKLGDMTYEEWLKAKPIYNPIKLPAEKAEAIKKSYIAEYRSAAARLGM